MRRGLRAIGGTSAQCGAAASSASLISSSSTSAHGTLPSWRPNGMPIAAERPAGSAITGAPEKLAQVTGTLSAPRIDAAEAATRGMPSVAVAGSTMAVSPFSVKTRL